MASKLIRFVASITLLWAFVLIYMSVNLYQLVEESRKATNDLNRANEEVVLLRRENSRLQKENIDKNSKVIYEKAKRTNHEIDHEENIKRGLQTKLDNAMGNIKILETKLQKSQASNKHSMQYELLRRRISNQMKEMWFYISSEIGKLKNTIPETAIEDFNRYLDNFGEMQRITENDFDDLMKLDNAQDIRDQTAKEFSDIVQKRLYKLQHPSNCETARKLVCTLNKGCGYGCQMHHVLYCFIVAYATKRVLIIDSSGWRYSSRGWNAYFQPVSSSCTYYRRAEEWNNNHESALVVHLPIVDAMFPRPKTMPLSVPRDLYDQIISFHGHPFVWWISQFTKYMIRLNPNLREEVEKKKQLLHFRSPIVGVQVRRTDKINLEASFHKIEEYMYYVDLYYKKLELSEKIDKRRVFLATDDPSVLSEARRKYPDYLFLSDNDVSKSAGLSKRYSDESLHGVITDIELLSDTDFLVCTFSSQVCRLAYEIMNHKHTDASQNFRSLDDIYYFGGQQEHKVKAIWPHKAAGRSEIDLNLGDIIGIAGNHWDGQSKGRHHGTQRTGLFPSYKVTDVHDIADFPVFTDD